MEHRFRARNCPRCIYTISFILHSNLEKERSICGWSHHCLSLGYCMLTFIVLLGFHFALLWLSLKLTLTLKGVIQTHPFPTYMFPLAFHCTWNKIQILYHDSQTYSIWLLHVPLTLSLSLVHGTAETLAFFPFFNTSGLFHLRTFACAVFFALSPLPHFFLWLISSCPSVVSTNALFFFPVKPPSSDYGIYSSYLFPTSHSPMQCHVFLRSTSHHLKLCSSFIYSPDYYLSPGLWKEFPG